MDLLSKVLQDMMTKADEFAQNFLLKPLMKLMKFLRKKLISIND